MSTIRQAVESVLDRSYMQYAEPAIQALEVREAEAVETLRDYAEGRGLGRDEVDSLLIDAGLMEATATSGSPDQITLEGIARQLETINQRLDRAAQQVQRHGIRF